ncbi:MAG: hypothetical protein C0506_05085 [Anaerolinea sp.]|nr:hypothetical protein [Anaerolinea sp.]
MHPTDASRRNVRLLYAYWFMRDFQLWIPVWIVFLTIEKGFSLTQVTLAEGLFLVGVICLEVPTGAVADKWGRSRSMALGALCLGGAVLIFAFTESFALLVASFLLWSVAQTLMSGADMALLFDTLRAAGDDARYERVLGRGHALNWAAAGIATLLGGPVAALLDIRATIFLGAGTCLLTALLALALWEPPRKAAAAPRQHYLRSIRSAFGEAWHTADVRTVILLAGTVIAALEAVHYVIQPYLLDRGVEVGVWFSMLQAPMILAGTLGALAAARLQGRIGTLAILGAIPLIGAGAFGALAATPGLWAYAALPLLFALSSILQPVATGFVNRRIGSEQRATVLSIQGMTTALVMAALAPGVGFVTDRWGLPLAFAGAGAVALAALAAFGAPLAVRWRRPEQASATIAADA